jgi:hypothetical protein
MKMIRKSFTTALLLLTCFTAGAQSPAMFNQVFGGPGYEYGYSIKQTWDKGYLIAGTTSSSGSGATDGYIVKTDSLGLGEWQKIYGGPNIDIFQSLILLPDSGFMIAGYTNSKGAGGYDGWMVRCDKNGDTLWTKTVGTIDWDFFTSVDTLKDMRGFIFTGSTFGKGAGDEDVYAVKTNLNGDTMWTHTYGGIKQEISHQVVCGGDSDLTVIGMTRSYGDSLGDIYLVRINTLTGDTLWTRRDGSAGHADEGWGIADKPLFARMHISGSANQTGAGDQAYVNEYYYNGTEVPAVELTFGGTGDDVFRCTATLRDGATAFAGTYATTGGMDDMYYFVNYLWCFTTFGTLQMDEAYSMTPTSDSGAALCGYTQGFNSFLPNMYLVKVSKGCASTQVVGIHENGASAGFGNAVEIYPQPLTEQSRVLISSQNEMQLEDFRFDLYDMAGRYLGNYAHSGSLEQQGPNTATFLIDRNQLEAGCYGYHISSGNRIVAAGKLMVSGR